ncbi:Hsp70 family protein [Actinoplanes sp. NBRC 103695]|uniref:Hsp70 family protein n=1 Tax=Actinoplanes sp. NBRC 103695 TaxID=3032202 RepID=UPI002554CDAC|nr:Hsp70 family protein [Actinoplanes sp. NBRC 103695]
MAYTLGVDLGTTYTAAAVRTDGPAPIGQGPFGPAQIGQAQIVQLGSRRAEIPSLVFLREDGVVLVGDAAERRGAREPARLAREFKRRLGDPVPVLVGGSPIPAHALIARVMEHVRETVIRGQEGPPARVSVTHPANWGPYKRELLLQAMTLAEVRDVELRTEPEAAAVQYASQERVRPGEVVAVYDLGGGTFDAAVLRKTDTGFQLLGEPAGIEQLGGGDFDEAVLAHVVDQLGPLAADLDPADPAVVEALGQLRRECVVAKEDLSSDTEVLIPVALPSVHTRVRLNRSEFERMISPALRETVAAMRRALRSAGVDAGALRSILLAGGSSRIPLVSELLSTEFGRPLVLDANPEHSIALGAALASGTTVMAAPPARPVAAAVVSAPARPIPDALAPPYPNAPAPPHPNAPAPPHPNAPARPYPTAPYPTKAQGSPLLAVPPARTISPPAPAPLLPAQPKRTGRAAAITAAALAVALIAGGTTWFLLANNGDEDNRGGGPTPGTGASLGVAPSTVAPQIVGAWKRLADLPVAVDGAAVTAYRNKVWVAGGLAKGAKLTSVYVFDPRSGKWSAGPALPRQTSGGVLVATPWTLYLLGGATQDGGASTQVLKLSPDATAWLPDVPLPEARAAGAAAFDGSHVIYAGGATKGGVSADTVWSLEDGRWTSIGRLSEPRQDLAAVGGDEGGVSVLGGRDAQRDTTSGVIDRIAQGKVTRPRTVEVDPPVHSGAAVRVAGIGTCLVGGETGQGYSDWWCDTPSATATQPRLDPQRAGLGSALIGRTVYVVGGHGAGFQGLNQLEAFTAPE